MLINSQGVIVLQNTKTSELVRRNKIGDVIWVDPVFKDAREVLVPRTHKKAYGFRLDARANFKK